MIHPWYNQYFDDFPLFFGGWRGYRLLNQKHFLNFVPLSRLFPQLKTHRKRAFQKELNLSFHKHQKLLKSVQYRKSYEGKCIRLWWEKLSAFVKAVLCSTVSGVNLVHFEEKFEKFRYFVLLDRFSRNLVWSSITNSTLDPEFSRMSIMSIS